MNNPFAMLHAALTTNRPELLTAFQRSMKALAESEEPLDPELVTALTQALVNVSTEVYDLRRTVDAMLHCTKHVHQALIGSQRHLEVAREIANRGRAGSLPDVYGPAALLRAIKDEQKEEAEAEAEEGVVS